MRLASTSIDGYVFAKRSEYIQWVVTRRWCNRPAAAKMNAPEQIDATRRAFGAIERTHSTSARSLLASSQPNPPTTTRVSKPSVMSP